MCDCIKNTAKKLEDHLKGKIKPENVYSYDSIGFDNECIMFSSGGGSKSLGGTAIGLPFSISYNQKKKDGTRSERLTTVKTNLFMTYCPICGKKYPSK